MKQKNGISLPGMGLSALLVIFGVLALTVFALLSVSTARAQQRLGEKARQPVTAYYQADAQAQQILARLRAGEVPPEVTVEQGVYRYRCSLGQDQYLDVEVAVTGLEYEILRWQVCSEYAWTAEDDLSVWDGKE